MYQEWASGIPGAVRWEALPTGAGQVLPDGCMDLIWLEGVAVVAGPDTFAFTSSVSDLPVIGLRCAPGVLAHLLGAPADLLRDARTPLTELLPRPQRAMLRDLAPDQAGL